MLKGKRVLSVILTLAMILGLFMIMPAVSNAATNIALNKTATASSSHTTTNVPAKAFDGNTGTRWESDWSDPQWISVDLESSYSVTGVKIIWETAAGKEYKIQVSADNSSWTDAYTVTNGTNGATLDVTFPAKTGRYVRMYGTTRTTGYGYSIYEFEVYAGESQSKVATPVISPATGTYASAQTVSITSGTSGAAIRYTINGTNPSSTTGTVYSGPFTVSSTTTVKAIAYKAGMTDSDVSTSLITISTVPPLGNIALNKAATASSSRNTTNVPAKAFDGNTDTRWESEFSDPQWVTVDLGSSYTVTGVKLNWETAAGKDYKIQVSTNNSTWTDAYTRTGGTGGIENITFGTPRTGRYVRMYGTARTTGYGYSLWEFEVYGSTSGGGTVPAAPTGLRVNSYNTNSVSLGWNAVSGATGYNIYRSFASSGIYAKVNSSPITSTSYTNTGLDTATYYYKVSALNADGESAQSTSVSATTTLDFGPNVKIFDTSMSTIEISNICTTIFNQMESNQFGSQRYALLFKPGTYNLPQTLRVGYYTHVAGLGQRPDDVTIGGAMMGVDAGWMSGNATCNFWRSAENLATSTGIKWAVSQAAPMRRVHIKGDLTLHENGGWASGGFLADSLIDGTVVPGSQQQWLSRNSRWAGWSNGVWNMVFVGCVNSPAPSYPNPPYTVVNQTPVIKEKPFLYLDGSTYKVFVPALKTNSSGISWSSGIGSGQSLSLDSFVIAHSGISTAASLNQALSQGKNIIFTPGIYQLNEPLRVTNANTVILGLGLATLTPTNGNACMQIADVDGVSVAGLLFDAGATKSPVLLEVGPRGSSANHSANPTVLSDLFFRVGGAGAGKADVCSEINSNDVIGDDFWVWRADHGTGVGWTVNTTKNGIVVNGNNVTIYALMVEHFHEYQTIWNGNGGRVYFYQSEIPYDVPSQAAWMNGSVNGFASYKVANSVTTHETWGFGVYSYFRDAPVKLNSAIETPVKAGVKHHNTCTVWLAGNPSSEITHIINNTGAAAVQGVNMRQTLAEFP